MRIDGTDISKTGMTGSKKFIQYFTRDEGNEVKDRVNLDNSKEDKFVADLLHMKEIAKNSVTKALFMPSSGSVAAARNEIPVVIVHGTMADGKTFENYKDAALQCGHPAELTTYMTVKDGEMLQKSGQVVSRNINNSRVEVTKKHLEELSFCKNNPEALKEFFQINSEIYGSADKRADRIVALIPGVIDKMENLLKSDKEELLETFSGSTKEIEKELAAEVRRAGFSDKKVAEKVASEIMDTLSPKVVLIGHSMGGFVSYTLALNPKEKAQDGNEFTYDGGNGISTIITLSSPVAKGVSSPLPSGLSNLTYNLIEKNVMDPMETFPGMQFSMVNPFFNIWYSYNKSLMKEMYKQSADMSAMMTNPIIHAMKPGYEQIAEGSSFIKNYVHNKKVPQGITAIAIYNPEDGVSEPENSVLNESQPNAHNLSVTVPITAEDLKNPMHTRPTEAHKKMSLYPFEHGEKFKHDVLEDPKHITRILDPSNYDGVRWRCLSVLKENLEKDPSLFQKQEFKPVLEKIKSVAAEKLPFADSPSCVAQEILDIVG